MTAAIVLVWWPITFVLGLLGSGVWLLVISMVLAVMALPALVVLLVRSNHRSRAAARRPFHPTAR